MLGFLGFKVEKATNIMRTNKLESHLRKELSRLKKSLKTVDFLRLYDSASGRNYIPKQPADFLIFSSGFTVAVECKESKSTSIPLQRLTQLPRLLRLRYAGVECFFLIEHKGNYYVLDVEEIKEYADNSKRKSYPFTVELKAFDTLHTALEHILWRDI